MVSLLFGAQPVGTSIAAQSRGEIRIVTEHYPPYEMQEPHNGLRGFDYEIAIEAFQRLGYEPQIVFLPWRRALEEVRQGNAAGVLTCAHTEERESFILYSDPISSFTSGFFVRADHDGPIVTALDDVHGLSVASVSSYETLLVLEQLGLNPIEAPNTELAIRMLLQSRFDYLYLSEEATAFLVKEMGLSKQVRFHPVSTSNFHFCFSRSFDGVEDIAKAFNRVMDTIRADGTYDRIHDKYR